MNSQLAPLVQLQVLDLRSIEIKEQRRKIPSLLEAAERPLRDAQKHLQDATAATDKSLKARREREQDLEAHEGHISKLKARSTEIKKNVEYQAHLFEIQVANKKKGEIEEEILLLMDQVEQQQRVVKEVEGKVKEAESRFSEKKTEMEALDATLSAESGELEQKQREVAKSVDNSLLDRYTKLKSTRKDLAVTPVRNGICSGCRLQIPPQLVAEVKRSTELVTCGFCERILYWEGESGSPTGVSAEPQDEAPVGVPETAPG